MADLNDFVKLIYKKLIVAGLKRPHIEVLRSIVDTMYSASMRREEGRFVTFAVSFADPADPVPDPPSLTRADYPTFTPLTASVAFNVDKLVKMGRAVDEWGAALAVYGESAEELRIWGILDQRVHYNVMTCRERQAGWGQPGEFTLVVNGVGEISAFSDRLFLGTYRPGRVISKEVDAIGSSAVRRRISPVIRSNALCIARFIGEKPSKVLDELHTGWEAVVARLCIGMRRVGVGGALVLSSSPITNELSVGLGFNYDRLADAMELSQLQLLYQEKVRALVRSSRKPLPMDLHVEELFATADVDDREDEITGAVRLIVSLSTLDGALLLTPDLRLRGVGVKLSSPIYEGKVFRGDHFLSRGARADLVSLADFGTRHRSIISYCKSDSKAIGMVVSQDGQVRLVLTVGRSVALWDNVKIADHQDSPFHFKAMLERRRKRLSELKRKPRFGYTNIPKTLRELSSASPLVMPQR
jgi:Probable sensor domain DACNV